ncbi:MAG: Gfo/Idh/MocA family oxidoreductase [Desulforhopalus sp.]
MINYPEIHVLVLCAPDAEASAPWHRMSGGMPHFKVDYIRSLPDFLVDYDAVITLGEPLLPADIDTLLHFVRMGGGWFALINGQRSLLPEVFGVQPGEVGPRSEIRVLFQDADHPLSVRLPDAIYVSGPYHPLQVTATDTETLLYADWHYSHAPVWSIRSHGAGKLACTSLNDFARPVLRQVACRMLRDWQGTAPMLDASLGVGILGYAPSVGRTHGLAVTKTPGLTLKAVCDLNDHRLSRATAEFPDVVTHGSAAALAENRDVDLVIVATAPNIHAKLSIEMMNAGKHVVCEKPLALNRKETDAMQEMAVRQAVHLSCHQNRRWDPDFRMIHDCVHGGRIGELYYLETFVGGFHHPCGYWHSHSPVSGGTTYDWGAHYLDWIVGLMPDSIAAVIGTRHKRVWHDVTNGDQERIQIRFADGREAEFLHSDIAAARKPKWYLLGTEGAISGNWQDITAFEADPIYYFQQTGIPATEMTPDIILHHRSLSGDIEMSKPVLPPRDPFAFHRNLADHLLWGEPLAAPLTDSVKVVAILESAARSMANNGRLEVFDNG